MEEWLKKKSTRERICDPEVITCDNPLGKKDCAVQGMNGPVVEKHQVYSSGRAPRLASSFLPGCL